MRKKKSLKFQTNLQFTKEPKKENQDSVLHLRIAHKSKLMTLSKEKLDYDLVEVVSQLGGVFSLFLGFSVFGLISDILDTIKRKI